MRLLKKAKPSRGPFILGEIAAPVGNARSQAEQLGVIILAGFRKVTGEHREIREERLRRGDIHTIGG